MLYKERLTSSKAGIKKRPKMVRPQVSEMLKTPCAAVAAAAAGVTVVATITASGLRMQGPYVHSLLASHSAAYAGQTLARSTGAFTTNNPHTATAATTTAAAAAVITTGARPT
eukprot:19894-Heterococcus_DN1.PRE.2